MDSNAKAFSHVYQKVCPLGYTFGSYITRSIATTKNFTMIWDDINNIEKYTKQMDDVHTVYHLAASADISKSFHEPTMDLENNVMGTSAVLELMRKQDIKNLIFASSSSVYGETLTTPTPESAENIKPISLYGASKLANEAFINSYCHLYGMKAWMFRFANVVGRYMHRGVIFDFNTKLHKNPKQLLILGDGKQEKSFFDVDDCIEGMVYISSLHKIKESDVFNLGNKNTITVKQLADVVCDELHVKPKYIYSGGDRGWPGDTPYTILSIEKALDIGWEPQYNCEESIRRTVRYLNNGKET